MKILVTGGTGFLGKHVQQAFKNSTNEIMFPSSKGLNLLDSQGSMMLIRAFKPDVILHMAAVCGGILANKNSPADFLHKNLDMASNIFHAAREVNVKYVYTLGSVCAYPKNCRTPFIESDLWNGYPEETNAPYGIAKRALLMLGTTYREQYGIGGAHLIPVNMYGEHDHFDPVNSHVIPALIKKFDHAVDTGSKVVECWGSGQATREFLYAGDAAQAIVTAIESGLSTDQPINLGVGEDISIKDLALLIGRLTGFDADDALIKFNGEVSDGQPKRLLSTIRAKNLLGWKATTSLKDGLKNTIRWYRDNKASL